MKISSGWVSVSFFWHKENNTLARRIFFLFFLGGALFIFNFYFFIFLIFHLNDLKKIILTHPSCKYKYNWSSLVLHNISLRIHWRLSTILETSNISVWINVFRYIKVCIFWDCIQYTIHRDKTQILKKFLTEKINSTKKAFLFL